MKRLAFLSLLIPTLIAPIQAQAQTGCVRFAQPPPPNPEAELRYLLSHPAIRVCPGPNPDTAGQRRVLQQISRNVVNNTTTQICAMYGQRC
jgi:hypothetical protein